MRDEAASSRPRRPTRARARCSPPTSTRAAPGRPSRARYSSWIPRRPSRCGSWSRHRPLAARRPVRAHAQALRDPARPGAAATRPSSTRSRRGSATTPGAASWRIATSTRSSSRRSTCGAGSATAVRIVPILCGGFHALLDDGRDAARRAAFEALIEAVRGDRARAGRRHRPRRGGRPLARRPALRRPGARTSARSSEIETQDRAALEAARRGDADGWYAAIAAHDDATRICGWAPTYAMLRAPSPARADCCATSSRRRTAARWSASRRWSGRDRLIAGRGGTAPPPLRTRIVSHRRLLASLAFIVSPAFIPVLEAAMATPRHVAVKDGDVLCWSAP